MNFNDQINSVLHASVPETDMINVIEALGSTPENFQQSFEVALEMENSNLVKLIYSNFSAGKIIVELTLLGKAEIKKLRA